MESKKSFILYCDIISMVEKLPMEKRGELFTLILQYVNDKNPSTDDLLLQVAFEPIKTQLKRDLGKWVEAKEQKANSGNLGNLKRWNPDLYEKVSNDEMTIEKAMGIAKHRKASQCDNSDRKESQEVANIAVNVNDSVSVSVNENVIKKGIQKELWKKLNKKQGLESSYISIMKDLYSLTDQQLKEQFEYWIQDKEESDLEEFSKVKNSLSKWIKDYAQKNKLPLIEKHNEVFRVIHNDEEYVTSLANRWGCEVRQVQNQIADFREMLLLKEEYKESIQKAKTHYLNWVASGNKIESKKKVYVKS